MYAVIRTGGKQYRVSKGEVLRVETLTGEVGSQVSFDEVLAVSDKDGLKTGTPIVSAAKVQGKIVEHGKGDKINVFKFKKNSQYKILRGHRQRYTEVEITEISAS